jgi:hypothetical protein
MPAPTPKPLIKKRGGGQLSLRVGVAFVLLTFSSCRAELRNGGIKSSTFDSSFGPTPKATSSLKGWTPTRKIIQKLLTFFACFFFLLAFAFLCRFPLCLRSALPSFGFFPVPSLLKGTQTIFGFSWTSRSTLLVNRKVGVPPARNSNLE